MILSALDWFPVGRIQTTSFTNYISLVSYHVSRRSWAGLACSEWGHSFFPVSLALELLPRKCGWFRTSHVQILNGINRKISYQVTIMLTHFTDTLPRGRGNRQEGSVFITPFTCITYSLHPLLWSTGPQSAVEGPATWASLGRQKTCRVSCHTRICALESVFDKTVWVMPVHIKVYWASS